MKKLFVISQETGEIVAGFVGRDEAGIEAEALYHPNYQNDYDTSYTDHGKAYADDYVEIEVS